MAEAEGRGFAEEAARAVRAWAYGELGLGHARQLHRPGNAALDPRSPSGSAPSPTRTAPSCAPDAVVWRHPGPEARA